MADGISSEMVLLTNAHGMNLTDPERDTISTTSFMSSSDQAYAVTEDTQKQGSYTLGAVATETIESTDEDTDSGDEGTADESDNDAADEGESDSDSTETKESRLTVICS